MDQTDPAFGQPGWRLTQNGVVVIALVAAVVLSGFSFLVGWGARGFAQHVSAPRYAVMRGEYGRAAVPAPSGRGYMRQPGDEFGPEATLPPGGCPSQYQGEREFQRGPGW